MNERLKQIMLDHGLHKYITEDCQHRVEKLAELIVRECANVAADHDALDIYEEIREHFGVEE